MERATGRAVSTPRAPAPAAWSAYSAALHQVYYGQQEHSSDEGRQEAPEAEDVRGDLPIEEKPTDCRAQNADDDVTERSLLRVAGHYKARKPSDDRAEQNPKNERNHLYASTRINIATA